jgi:hypothetical protein
LLKTVPPRQPLPTPVHYPDKPFLKLGLDVHLEFIMAVVQRDHATPQAPRKFMREQHKQFLGSAMSIAKAALQLFFREHLAAMFHGVLKILSARGTVLGNAPLAEEPINSQPSGARRRPGETVTITAPANTRNDCKVG